MTVIESRHAEKLEARKEEYEEKVRARHTAREAGKKPRGPEPKEPEEAPGAKDQYNFTDPYLAVGKQSHGIALETILGTAPEPELSEAAGAKERMAHSTPISRT